MNMEENTKIHPIGYVARQTGLSVHVIRAWEKRYGAVQPGRTPTGRRLYSESDIRHLKLLNRANRSGHRIAQLSELDDQALQEIVDNKAVDTVGERKAALSTAEDFLDACRAAVISLDGPALEAALNRAAVHLTRPMLIKEMIAPLAEEIGNLWSEGSLKIIHEHMASSILRAFMWDMLSAHGPQPAAPGILVATPAEQWHELGALMVAITAADAGWSVYYFGPNLPAEEIAAAAAINRVKAVALSIVYRTGEAQVVREIRKLRQYLAEDIALIVGGSGIRPFRADLKEIGALHIQDLPGLRKFLNQSF